MAVPVIKTAFVVGEVAPSMFGHVDLARMQAAASTMRNMWPSYHGGAYSRAGTAFVGFSRQTGRAVPPRLIPFQFSIKQGLALEFGNFYMRVISDGAFVTEAPFKISAATQSNPATVTVGSTFTAVSATANNGAVSASYNAADLITLAGGVSTIPAVLRVNSTSIASLALNSRGQDYVPGDTITLAGGSPTIAGQVRIPTTRVKSLAIVNGGTGLTPGAAVATGTTGTGTKFSVNVTVNGSGVISAIGAFVSRGAYTVNPSNTGNEPVTVAPPPGGPAIQPIFSMVMEIDTFTLTNPGSYIGNAAGGIFTQASTTSFGFGATFNTALFLPNSLSVSNPGLYTVIPANPAAQASTTGTGVGATYTVIWQSPAPLASGDWVYVSEIVYADGSAGLNGGTYVATVAGAVLTLRDVYGNAIDATGFAAYVSGGDAARIFTLPTIYAEADELWLKPTQSADVMSVCCVNQDTRAEYPPQDLSRISDTDWVFTPAVPGPSVAPPATASGTTSSAGSVDYQYVVTAVSPADGSESIASPIARINAAVNILATAGTLTLTWAGVAGVNQYNIYKASPGLSAEPPAGALFGYAGSAYGTQFLDGPSAIVPDFAQVPPLHKNPFARGQATAIAPLTGGATYTTATATINSFTGSGAVFTAVIVGGAVVAYIQDDAGEGYQPTDTVTITGDGTGATATLMVGPQSGTYPGVVAYFQQRRAYAFTLNNPDTYFMSQPGAFTNFDSRIPPIDSDAIIGTPWAVQVNGIQWMIQTSGGLLVFTGLQAWLLVGAGSFATNAAVISPSSQDANPQPAVGCSPTLAPIKINYDVLFADANSCFYYDLPYQLYALSEPLDMTQYSSHLFVGFSFVSHAWCRQPYKLLWPVRDDGSMLSLTFLKAQEVQGWARHDTQGLFQSNCQVTEPPVDALYLATQRFPPTWSGGQNTYLIERMDDRIWPGVEDVWAVDCGLRLPQPTPAATLSASSATGLGAISGVTGLVGGGGYSAATTASVVDDNGAGPGAGAVPALTIVGGVITAISFAGHNGAAYTYPALVISDPANTGSGASARLVLDNSMTFTADPGVFVPGDGGSVIRSGGGIATITAYLSATQVTANLTDPIVAVLPDGANTPRIASAGDWTLTKPVATISGLRHLAGLAVTGLADGNVIPPTIVNPAGQITLAVPASAVTLGLGFQAQLQGVYLETGEPTVQGQRKKIADVTARIEASRGLKMGSNQVDGSTLSPPQLAPQWRDMADVPDKARPAYNSRTVPLYTGDVRIPVTGGYATPGQVALQQDFPLPMQVLAYIPEVFGGDNPQVKWPDKKGRGE